MTTNNGESWTRPRRTHELRQELFDEPTNSERQLAEPATTLELLLRRNDMPYTPELAALERRTAELTRLAQLANTIEHTSRHIQ